MKTNLFRQLLGAVAITALSAFAAPAFASDILDIEGKVSYAVYATAKGQKIQVNLVNGSAGRVFIRIYDAKQNLIHSESHQGGTSMRRSYDLGQNAFGEYTVVLDNGSISRASTVFIGKPQMEQPEYVAYIADVVDGRIRYHFQHATEAVSVVLINDKGEEVYNQYFSTLGEHVGVLNLTELAAGTYTLRVVSGDKVQQRVFVR